MADNKVTVKVVGEQASNYKRVISIELTATIQLTQVKVTSQQLCNATTTPCISLTSALKQRH